MKFKHLFLLASTISFFEGSQVELHASPQAAHKTITTILRYTGRGEPNSTYLRGGDARATPLELTFREEKDRDGHVIALYMLMRERGGDSERNLLETVGNLHGYQPFDFAASDFAGGVRAATYEAIRNISVPKYRLLITSKIVDVSTRHVSSSYSPAGSYEFVNISMRVTASLLTQNVLHCAHVPTH
jgi:hypothetical protein